MNEQLPAIVEHTSPTGQPIDDADLAEIEKELGDDITALGDVEGHPFHGNQWSEGSGGRTHDEEDSRYFLESPKDALHSLLNGDTVNIDRSDVHEFLKRAAKQKEDPDLTDVHVDGTLMFGGNGLGIKREDMPQIPKENREEYVNTLRQQGFEVKREDVDPLSLAPSQKEISARLAGEKLHKYEKDPERKFPPILISKDNRVLDGHHHWGMMAAVALDHPSARIPVYRIMQNARPALAQMKVYAKAHGYTSKGTGSTGD